MTPEHPLREVLGRVDLRRLLAVRMAGQFADGLFQAPLFSAVFFNPERATSAGEAAVAFATLLLPYSVVGPFAGVLLDRWRRQRVLRNGNMARAGAVVGFAGLLAVQGPTAPAVVASALLIISTNRFVLSGLSASLPHVVAEERLVTANSLTTTLGAGAAAAGGAFSLALRPVFGTDDSAAAMTALVAACCYLAAGLLAATIPADLLGPDGVLSRHDLLAALRAVPRGVVAGAAHLGQRPRAGHALAAITAHRFFYGLSFIATLLLYTDSGAIGRGFTGLGQVIVSSVAGGLLAAVVTPGVTRRVGIPRWVAVVFAAAAAVELAFGWPFTHGAFLVAAFFLGFAAQAAKICVDALLQDAVNDDFRGRVFSFYDTAFNLSFVAAGLAAAVLLPADGKSHVVIGVVAGGYALTSLAYAAVTLLSARRAAKEAPAV